MDLPDIKIVVQWRATCSIATLWQRFGRGARDLSQEATAVFLVEKDHFDEERKKKEERKAKRKAKATVSADSKKSKRNVQGHSRPIVTTTTVDQPELSDSDKSDNGDDAEPSNFDRLHARYQQPHEKPKTNTKTNKRILDPAVDDLINAGTRGLGCRRFPVHVSFENHKSCECNVLNIYITKKMTRSQHQITCNAIPHYQLAALVATSHALVYAVTCTVRQHSKIFLSQHVKSRALCPAPA